MSNNNFKTCIDCEECVYIGEGDYLCTKGEPFVCMEDHCPNEFFCACHNPILWRKLHGLSYSHKKDNKSNRKGGDRLCMNKR